MSRQKVVHSDPEVMGGTPVFVGTRVPVKPLFDYIKAGDNLDEFLEDFPGCRTGSGPYGAGTGSGSARS